MGTLGGREPPGEAADLGDVLSVRAFRFAEAVAGCSDIAQLSRAFQAVILTIGMTASASGMISGPKRASDDIFHFTNWPQDWRDLYEAEGFVHKDPVPRWAVVSGAPIAWHELLDTLAPDDPGREVYARAAERGFVEGFVTPVRGPDGSLGLVSVGGNRPRLLPQERIFLQSISVVTLLRAEELSEASAEGSDPASVGLQARERAAAGESPDVADRPRSKPQSEPRSGGDIHPDADLQEAPFRRRFGLTPAEWRVAAALYEGASLNELAAASDVSINTVRAQLRSVYAKTGVHRQSELVRLMRPQPGWATRSATS